MGSSQGNEKNEEEIKESQSTEEKNSKKNTKKENNEDNGEENDEQSDSENGKNEEGEKSEEEKSESKSDEENSAQIKSSSNKENSKKKFTDFSKDEENEEKKSKNSSELRESQKEKEKEENKEEKSESEKEIKKNLPTYTDALPGEIPEERKVSNPTKLPFQYKCCQTIENAHKKEITTLAYILRRNEIATGSVDETIKIWKINTEKNKMSLNKELKGHTDSIICIKDFPKLNCFCSTSADNSLKLWNCSSLKCVKTLEFHTKCVLTCCYNPIGNQEIFSGGEDCLICIWTTTKKELKNYEKKMVLKGHTKRISSLAYADDYEYLISGSDDKTIRIWEMKDINDIQCIKEIKDLLSEIDYLLYLDNRLLVSCEDGVISFIKMNKKKRCRSIKFSNSAVYSFNIFHKHKYLLVGSKDGKARIWKIGTNKREVLKGHTKAITGVADFEEDFVITGSLDCSLKLWKKE
jgi:WD40 repeat protein